MKRLFQALPTPREIWTRSSTIVRLLLYLAGVDVFLFLLKQVFLLFDWPHAADTLRTWLISIGIICALLFSFVFLRWLRKKVMWRLRNRLIVTYVFIGVIPTLLLLGLGAITTKLLLSQFATFLATSDIQDRIQTIDKVNSAMQNQVLRAVSEGHTERLPQHFDLLRGLPSVHSSIWYRGAALSQCESDCIRPPAGNKDVAGITEEAGRLYLRVSRSVSLKEGPLVVVSSERLDEVLLNEVTRKLGEVVVTGYRSLPNEKAPVLLLRAGKQPPATGRLDISVDFYAPVALLNWTSGEVSEAQIVVSTRPSALFDRLFANLGTQANAILVALFVIAAMLALIELLALVIGIRLTRTMTRSVYELYRATEHINRGEFAYRINVRGYDQMAELETAFNSMSHSLEGLIAEQKEKQRMESELAIAHEVQEQLFPRDLGNLKSLEVHGVCRPARSVSGDYYDFLPLGNEKMGLAVGDISGKGISAALLMANIHSAVRVYEMGRIPVREQLMAAGASAIALASESVSLMPTNVIQSPATVLGLLNRHLFHSTPAEKYATMFFGMWNGQDHTLTYSNAGHLPPFIVRHNGTIEELTIGGTVIGLFNDVAYEEAVVRLAPGELFVAYSDGLTEPENEFGEFGSARLIDLVRKCRNSSLPRISDIVTSSVMDWIGAAEQPDDVTLVLARAR